MGNWENDGECSKDCGGGVLKQKRSVITNPKNGGKACETNLQRTIPCNEQECLVNVLSVNNSSTNTGLEQFSYSR